MKIKDLFEQGLTSESTIHEMIELLASLKEETGPEASNKREFNKVQKQHARGWESRSTSAEHVKVHDAGGHTIFHHGDSDGLDHGFVGKHPEGHSSTSIDLGYESSSHDIEKEVAKQNPHLSPETHKLLTRHIHKQVMTNESVNHTTSNRSQSPLIDATLSYLGTATSLNEANEPKEKKGTAWTRKLVGKGSTAHNSRGSFGGSHSLTHAETQARVQKAVEAGRKSGDVVSHDKTTDDDGTVHHSIMLSKPHGYYRHVHISSHPDRAGGDANTNFAPMSW